VGPEAPKRGTIVSLSDKCDSCVVLQICGSCHDDANDPGFEFEVVDKIERQRHAGGGAGREGALLPRPEHVIGRAFALGAAAGEGG
jgi:hypothetical protein